jgi:HPt (histidine-containing phosphotransfer) domain-containing protein
MSGDAQSSTPIRSEFASDPDMAELVAEFVGELPDKSQTLNAALQQNQFADLQRLSHQLKGACGGYGFPQLGEAAAKLEARLKQLDAQPKLDAVEDVTRQVNELVELCRRASV